jgi:hypothetical protein
MSYLIYTLGGDARPMRDYEAGSFATLGEAWGWIAEHPRYAWAAKVGDPISLPFCVHCGTQVVGTRLRWRWDRGQPVCASDAACRKRGGGR